MEELAAPRSEITLLVMVADNSPAPFGIDGDLLRLTETGSDPDLSMNANARFSFSNPMWVQKRGQERRVERQY